MAYNVGDTVVLDGIESVIVYDAGSEQSWGRYLCVDKNHDLVWYFAGSDFVDRYSSSDGCINLEAKYGYEWGTYRTVTNITSQVIGKGLSNTNSLISMNPQPWSEGWFVLWDKVEEFRANHSNDWFVPTVGELQKVYDQKSYLNNLSDGYSGASAYWSSSEGTESYYVGAFMLRFSDNSLREQSKYSPSIRARLCRYTTNKELDSIKRIQITTSTSQASIYYTTDNSTPNSNSNLYTDIFTVNNDIIIKAIGKKEGWDDSDVAELDVSSQTTSQEEIIRQSETNKTVNNSDKNI